MKLLLHTFCLLFFTIIWSQSVETTTIYLIRHCEKADTSKDPDLSDEGKLRAENWANYFDKIPIDYFYSTATIRTTTTCSIIATSQKKEIQLYDYKELTIKELVSKNQGKIILIVGHSNTIPTLINAFLGKIIYKQMDEYEFGNLYKITIKDDEIYHELTVHN